MEIAYEITSTQPNRGRRYWRAVWLQLLRRTQPNSEFEMVFKIRKTITSEVLVECVLNFLPYQLSSMNWMALMQSKNFNIVFEGLTRCLTFIIKNISYGLHSLLCTRSLQSYMTHDVLHCPFDAFSGNRDLPTLLCAVCRSLLLATCL